MPEKFLILSVDVSVLKIIEKSVLFSIVEKDASAILNINEKSYCLFRYGRCLEMENGLDRRACKRFDMNLPATIVQPSSGVNGNNFHLLLTRDISHSGAYFKMMKPFSYDGPVQVEILLEVPTDCRKCIFLYLVAKGEVVRRDDSGLAVIFNEDFMLAPFPVH